MIELLVILFCACALALYAFFAMWRLEEMPELAKYVYTIVAGTGGGIIGFLLVWLGKLLTRGPTKEQRQSYKTRPIQIVGKNCTLCDERILLISDAHICHRCRNVYCRNANRLSPARCAACLALVFDMRRRKIRVATRWRGTLTARVSASHAAWSSY